MTNSANTSLDDVRGLIEERERYDAWLATLEAKRDATPPHVFDRVRADYESRRQSVAERVSAGLAPLRESESALAGREAELVRSLAERQDELAELELRTLVGEFPAEEGERRVQATAGAVREIDGDRQNVAAELQGLRALLVRADGRREAVAAPAPLGPASVRPAPTVAAQPESPPVTAASPEPSIPMQAVAPVAETEPQVAEQASAPAPARAEAGFGSTGEHLGTLAAAFSPSSAQPATATVASGQEKTLRCQDCGEMNYPTEWYCERCGGELAAL